jgi:FtsH-binding integral membrane protein
VTRSLLSSLPDSLAIGRARLLTTGYSCGRITPKNGTAASVEALSDVRCTLTDHRQEDTTVSDTQNSQFTPAPPLAIAYASADVRFEFMKKTYGLLMAGIAAFIGIEVFLFTTGIAETIAEFVLGTSWLLILGGFMLVSWLANSVASKARTRTQQIQGYALSVVAQSLIFVPMLYIANEQAPGAISKAAAVSVVGFAVLSGIAITSSKDFSFLGAMLKWAGFAALGLIVMSVLFSFQLGAIFSVAMIAFAGGAILWDTQRIVKTYPEGTEVLAAMQLFSSVALLFWYVLRLFMSRR